MFHVSVGAEASNALILIKVITSVVAAAGVPTSVATVGVATL